MITESKGIRNFVKIFAVLAAVLAVVPMLVHATRYCIAVFYFNESFSFSYLVFFIHQGICLILKIGIALSLLLAAKFNKKWLAVISLIIFFPLGILYPLVDMSYISSLVREIFSGSFRPFGELLEFCDIVILLPVAVSILAMLFIKKGKVNKALVIISSLFNIIAIGFLFLLSAHFFGMIIKNIVEVFQQGYFDMLPVLLISFNLSTHVKFLFDVVILFSIILLMLGASGIITRKKKEKTEAAAVAEETKTAETGYVVTYAEPEKTEAKVAEEEKMPETKEANIGYADEIVKLKELYDMGAITEEEFSAKKKELLGL